MATDGKRSTAVDASRKDAADAGAKLRSDGTAKDVSASAFTLTSTAFQDNGTLPVSYTCDGAGHSPPLAWSGAPKGTLGYALLMTTLAITGTKWNWVLYDIPSTVSSLAASETGVGTCGITSDGPDLAYAPPCSSGPGLKTYAFTLYALSGSPSLPSPADAVTGPVLTAAIASLSLASAEITAGYTRPVDATAPRGDGAPPPRADGAAPPRHDGPAPPSASLPPPHGG